MWAFSENWDADEIRAHTLSALLEMAETNYRRLMLLIPEIDELPQHSVSRVNRCLDLHLHIHDRWRYTTNITLTYELEGLREPDLTIRLYHDARCAEAMSALLHRAGPLDALHPRATLYQKWTLNRFLYKWLGYCIRRGHRFRPEAMALADL
ncbi:MAG: DUF1249 domain-containing protein [Chromatiales bacterium]|nr:DUF1249 domain-containing protein [Chromatiales bacterium]